MGVTSVVEAVYLGSDFLVSVAACFVNGAPDQLGFDGSKDSFDPDLIEPITGLGFGGRKRVRHR
jgi:hypothetical protein